jgi:hypothetical protein
MDSSSLSSPPPLEKEEVELNTLSMFGNTDEVPPANHTNTNLAVFSPPSEKGEGGQPWPAVMDSILAAPLRVKETKIEVPIYSE